MEKNVSAIFALSSFILYFEFCVQILVLSGLKDGSNNIRPLRNQFQMLNVTNRSWKFGVGSEGGYQGTPIKEGTLFFYRNYTFSEFTTKQNGLCGFRMWYFQQ